MRLPDDGHNLFITHDFSSVEQAAGFAHDTAAVAAEHPDPLNGRRIRPPRLDGQPQGPSRPGSIAR